MKRKIRHILSRKKKATVTEPLVDDRVPRITNETVAAHREEVLGKARKYIYPLQHSKHRIVIISTSLFIVLVVGFFTYCSLALYKFQSTSTFIYRVTQVIPFPLARAGGTFISYEDYLFQLRHYIHYYQSQEQVDFNSSDGKQRLSAFKQQAQLEVINNAYVKKLAAQHNITVSDAEVNDEITIVRNQNLLGNSDKVFADVIKEYWGWSVDDFKHSLRQEILAQKVVSALDTQTHDRAQVALQQLKSGVDFATVVKQYSDDTSTKNNGGEYSGLINQSNRDLPAVTTAALFKLQPGQVSDIINTGFSLEIVKNIETSGDKIRAAHIVFNFKDITTYINQLKDKQKTQVYIK